MTIINTDITIIGAGIAGLWLHRRLNDLGYHCLLIDKEKIGGAQTLSSQGIIHGGTKYALTGVLSGAASAIGDMPKRWQACLEGNGEIDLSNTLLFTDHQLMWSTQSLSSKMMSFFSSKALSGRIKTIKRENTPDFFNTPEFKGNLYQLNEPVLDTSSLVKNLSEKWQHRIISNTIITEFTEDNEERSIILDNDYKISTQQLILTAGEGNEALLKKLEPQLDISFSKMQRRPLKMVLAKSPSLPSLYAHCIGANTKPIATITTHSHSDGDKVWYIGGNIAEEGVTQNDESLINNTIDTLSTIMPWFNASNVQWATHSINRAEPAQSNLTRPDTAFVETHKNITIAWPTKLALTPNLSDKVIDSLNNKIKPLADSTKSDEVLHSLPNKSKDLLAPTLWDSVNYDNV